MRIIILPAILFVTIFSSCSFFGGERIRGNGVIKTESRTAGTFNSVHVSGNADVYIKQDSVFSITVESDENLMEYILTNIDGNTLQIRPRDRANLKPSKSIKVYVSGPSLSNFEASGACDIISENRIEGNEKITIRLSGASDVKMELMAPEIKADLSGAGTITLTGQTKDFKVDGSGSTDIKCFDLLTENTTVDISGAGNAEVFASVKLKVEVSGAADVKYKGNATVEQKISGAGSVKKVD